MEILCICFVKVFWSRLVSEFWNEVSFWISKLQYYAKIFFDGFNELLGFGVVIV